MIGTVCHSIEIENFRNIGSASVAFGEGVNLLHGDNAQGKTNLLEAVYFTALGKSFRPVKEAELIRFGEESAHLVNRFHDSVRAQSLSFRIFSGRGKRVVEQNGMKIGRMSEMVGAFRVVLFCPEHLSLIQGGPELRRNYLNVALSQLRPLYLQSLQRYNKVLKERNALLKRAPEDMATFKATEPMWSAQLAHEAAAITMHRARYVRQINDHVRACFADMMAKYEGGDELPELIYQPTLGSGRQETQEPALFSDVSRLEERYLELLSTRHDREIGAGATLWGIHKDDIRITLNGRPARLYASQGQQRSLALAMKLAEGWVSAYESAGDMPVFLFDDVLSELDIHRRDYLVQEMKGRQVIMTACDPAAADFGGAVNLIHVDGGRYTRREV
ncbi:MAG: DNA replication/repair protein RecF [Clostridia bacterium]|nr:DNA replication/repair protein RecF [Clostridia bacterium]